MLDPISYWSRVMASWQVVGETGARLASTADASRDVIVSRTRTMTDVFRSPLGADYLELSRMVPEKIAAFSLSGNAVMQAWWKMQADWIEQAQQVGVMMMRGRVPTLDELSIAASSSSLYALRTLEAGASAGRAAVAPVHRSATANARRLKKRGS